MTTSKSTSTAIYLLFFTSSLLFSVAHAQQSSITEADGSSCMGDEQSRKQTENSALQDAKRLAIEFTSTYLESETVIENFQLKNDLVQAFAKANVQVIDILSKSWDDPRDCFTIRIRAEVLPNPAQMQKINSSQMMANPRAPLNVELWTNEDSFISGESIKIYLRGNKPFYARLLYIDAADNNVQLLPNLHRTKNYFAGATIFEVPNAEDDFELTVGGPFGKEKLILYASTSPLGEIATTKANDDVYFVTEKPEHIAAKTRGISITKPGSGSGQQKKTVAEFAEVSVEVVTREDTTE
ncbi:MAG: DUF4384 domain-containing protein [bacterium]|nr:DUF4384 domain-containing protein [Gammaproteobacteria bacterium]HIL96452.1 DUF4384 domain-containing protein [Pseudomonadales bacterium]